MDARHDGGAGVPGGAGVRARGRGGRLRGTDDGARHRGGPPRTLVVAVGGGLASSVLLIREQLPQRLPVRLYGERGADAAARTAGEGLAALGHDVERPWLPPLDTRSGYDFADYRADRARGGTAT